MKNQIQDWLTEYKDFLKSSTQAPPTFVSQRILEEVHAEFYPPSARVTAKLFVAHLLSAAIVLSVCPQLNVGPLIGGHGLGYFFMRFGPVACAALCGALFLSVSALLGGFLLSRPEVRVARQHGFANISLLVGITFAGLMLAQGSIAASSNLAWVIGATAGGWLALRVSSYIRLDVGF